MSATRVTTRACPGCGLALPPQEFPYAGYYHASRECWSVYTEVLAKEYQDAVLFGRVHQLTVDAYAVQHAGGSHPAKSVGVHLAGLHFALVRGVPPPAIPRRLQRLVARVAHWPHLEPPAERGSLTIFDVALADSTLQHEALVREWSAQVWRAWSAHHPAVATLAELADRERA